MPRKSTRSSIRRRTMLSTIGAVGVSGFGTVSADSSEGSRSFRRCPDATFGTDMAPCEGASMDGCGDDHQETIELRERAEAAIERRYATVGALIDRGFRPYFDVKRLEGSNGWSHWLSPEFIGDDTLLDPDRPESILVDNETWQPIGIMFIATVDGDPVDPPTLYTRTESENGDSDEERRCSPWHYHRGLPGRFAWKFYRQVYERDYEDGGLSIPCRTPCMMHVWTVPHPDGVYAHGAPPPEQRATATTNDPGFETDADPEEERLHWDVLPDSVVPEDRPDDLLELW